MKKVAFRDFLSLLGVDCRFLSMARTLQILCVDDDPLLRRMYAVVLGRLSYTATIVETVREALGYLDTAGHGFDLVLADWNLPEGGEDFAARLSEIDNDL